MLSIFFLFQNIKILKYQYKLGVEYRTERKAWQTIWKNLTNAWWDERFLHSSAKAKQKKTIETMSMTAKLAVFVASLR